MNMCSCSLPPPGKRKRQGSHDFKGDGRDEMKKLPALIGGDVLRLVRHGLSVALGACLLLVSAGFAADAGGAGFPLEWVLLEGAARPLSSTSVADARRQLVVAAFGREVLPRRLQMEVGVA